MLLGGEAIAVSAARSLSQSGVRVYALGDVSDPVRRSRHCHEFVAVGSKEGVIERYLEWLEHQGPRAGAILPCDDYGVEMIARHRARIEGWGYLPVEGDDEVMLAMLDKERTYELSRAAGVATPQTATVTSTHEAVAASAGFEFPVGLKATQSHIWAAYSPAKLLTADDPAELSEVADWAFGAGVPMLMTELIPGPEHLMCTYFSYIDANGEPLFHYTKSKIRQWPKGSGLTCYQISDWQPDVVEEGLRFFRGVGLRGIGSIEFKRDPRDGRNKIIECNHRFTGSSDLTRHCGIDIPLLAYNRLVGRPDPPLDRYATDVTQWNPIEDFRSMLEYRGDGEITVRRWLRSIARKQHFPMMRLDDPMPTVASLSHKVSRLAAKLRG
ncbi:MAG: D-aspartate ligase [Thermoleophilaceae bacterium]|nr:D-aspartate ligase [Thermoleophilaceae bacterium]